MSEQTRSQQVPFRQKEDLTDITVRPETDPSTSYSIMAEPHVKPDAEQLESLAILDELQARLTVMRRAARAIVPRTAEK